MPSLLTSIAGGGGATRDGRDAWGLDGPLAGVSAMCAPQIRDAGIMCRKAGGLHVGGTQVGLKSCGGPARPPAAGSTTLDADTANSRAAMGNAGGNNSALRGVEWAAGDEWHPWSHWGDSGVDWAAGENLGEFGLPWISGYFLPYILGQGGVFLGLNLKIIGIWFGIGNLMEWDFDRFWQFQGIEILLEMLQGCVQVASVFALPSLPAKYSVTESAH